MDSFIQKTDDQIVAFRIWLHCDIWKSLPWEDTVYFGLFFGYTYAPVITSSFKMPQSIYCEQNQNEKWLKIDPTVFSMFQNHNI